MLKIKSTVAAALAMACAAAFAQDVGVTDTSVKIGMVLDQSGSNKLNGAFMKEGAMVYFGKINAAGGVNGRKIEVVTGDDGYDPKKTAEIAKKMIDEDKVFAFTNSTGTAPSQALLPLVSKENIPLVGMRTGAEVFRAPLKKVVFNIRSSYFREIEGLTEHLVKDLGAQRIAMIYQNDSFGETSKVGLERALARRNMKPVGFAPYDKNDQEKMDAPYAAIKDMKPDAVIMAAIGPAGAAFIKKAYADKLGAKLAAFSALGDSFIKTSSPEEYEGMVISNILPEPSESPLAISQQFKADMTKAGSKSINSTAFEGYMNAYALVEGLKASGKELTRERFIKSMESLDKDVGGLKLKYGPNDHEGLDDIFFSKMQKGKAVPVSSFK